MSNETLDKGTCTPPLYPTLEERYQCCGFLNTVQHIAEGLKKKLLNAKETYNTEIRPKPLKYIGDFTQRFIVGFMTDDQIYEEEDDLVSNSNTNDDINKDKLVMHCPHRKISPDLMSMVATTSRAPNSTKKRLNGDELRMEYLELEKRKIALLEQKLRAKSISPYASESERSEDYHYVMSILPQMERLSSLQKMRLRNKFNQALLNEMARSEGSNSDRNSSDHSSIPTKLNNEMEPTSTFLLNELPIFNFYKDET